MDILQELQRSGLQISPVTDRAINKYGLGDITFKNAQLKYPDSLEIHFQVESSQGKGNETHFSNNGNPLAFASGYKVTIQFINFGSFAPPNLLSLPLSQQIIYIKEIFDKADIKVSCDCGAWYWQGTSELLDRNPPDSNYEGFHGQHGKGIWDTIHNTKNRICKHIYTVLENIDNYIPKILKNINKSSSISTSTTQNTNLQTPINPAGTPQTTGPGIEKTSTINAKTNTEEVKSDAERLDLPNMNISNVGAKSHQDESDVISGAEKTEPPIEEITLKKDQKEDEDLNKELPTNIKESILREIERQKCSALIKPNGTVYKINFAEHIETIEKLFNLPNYEKLKKKDWIKKLVELGIVDKKIFEEDLPDIDELIYHIAFIRGYIRISTHEEYGSIAVDFYYLTPDSKRALIDFLEDLESILFLNHLYINEHHVNITDRFIDMKELKQRLNSYELRLEPLKEIEEIKVNSPKDFELWKEWKRSEAYLYVTFENFKKSKKKIKSFKQILKENIIGGNKKIWYHGSTKKFDTPQIKRGNNSDQNEAPAFFITDDWTAALFFSGVSTYSSPFKGDHYIYTINITNPVNILDTVHNKKVQNLLSEKTNNTIEIRDYCIENDYDGAKLESMGIGGNSGFVSERIYETQIAFYKTDNLKIIGRYTAGEFLKKKIHKDLFKELVNDYLKSN
jgi:hypothetical protein